MSHPIHAAKDACYWRLHPEPWIDSSKGARRLYDAVCDLWTLIVSGHLSA